MPDFTSSGCLLQLSAIQSQPCYLLHWTGSKVRPEMAAFNWAEMTCHRVSECFYNLLAPLACQRVPSEVVQSQEDYRVSIAVLRFEGVAVRFSHKNACLQKISLQQAMYQTSQIDQINFATHSIIHKFLL